MYLAVDRDGGQGSITHGRAYAGGAVTQPPRHQELYQHGDLRTNHTQRMRIKTFQLLLLSLSALGTEDKPHTMHEN